MRVFIDEENREWNIHITTMSLKRVFEHSGFDIADLSNGKAVELFTGQTTYLLDVLWPLVRTEASTKGVSMENFGDAIRGDSVDRAIDVLREELLGFFPSKKRAMAVPLLKKIDAAMDEAPAQMEKIQVSTDSGGA